MKDLMRMISLRISIWLVGKSNEKHRRKVEEKRLRMLEQKHAIDVAELRMNFYEEQLTKLGYEEKS